MIVAWLNFSVSLEGSVWLLLFAVILSTLFSYFIYKQTTPPVNRFIRSVLFVLRSLALILVLAMFFHPILHIRHTLRQKPDIAVFIDGSRSMGISDGNVQRAEVVKKILSNPLWQNLQDQYSLHFWPFSNILDTTFTIKQADRLNFTGDGTDIAGALEKGRSRLLKGFYTTAVLISDGIYNMGENPEFLAPRYGVPVHTIGVGDPAAKKDVVISQVVTNELVYEKNKVPVDVTISQFGYTGKKIQVFLKQGKRVVDQKIVKLTQSDQDVHLRFHYKAEKAGFRKFQVQVPVQENEFTEKNNQRNFVVKVLESKVKIFLLAGEPCFDFKFMKRALLADENVDLFTYVQKKGGGNYEKEKLNTLLQQDFHLIIFLGFPKWPVAGQLANFLHEKLIVQKKPLFYLQEGNANVSLLRSYAPILPFSIKKRPGNPREVVVDPTVPGEESLIVKLSDNRLQNRKNWNDLPPIFTFINNYQPFADSDILLQIQPALSKLPVSGRYQKPVLISRQLDEQKSLAFLGQGFWRWDFMMWGVGKDNNLYLTFLERAIRWLITRETAKPVRFSTDKLVYRSGDQVYVQAQVYTKDYRPVEEAEVKLQVTHGKEKQEFSLETIGNGKYQTQFRVFQGGDYHFRGEAKRGDTFFGADSGKFSVGEYEIEFQQTRMNEGLLRKVASLSGGKYFTADSISQLQKELPVKVREKVQISEINLWNKWLILLLFLLLLSIEWFVRRRTGML